MIPNTLELQKYILQLVDANESNQRTLMEYLLALLNRLEQASDIEKPTFQDIADFIRDAYSYEQAEYLKEWEKLPDYMSEVNTEAYHAEIRSNAGQVHHLKRNLVKLERLRLEGQLSPQKLAKPGYQAKLFKDFYWTNLDVKSYLKGYAEYLGEIESDDEEEFTQSDWLTFGDLINKGPGYYDDLYG